MFSQTTVKSCDFVILKKQKVPLWLKSSNRSVQCTTFSILSSYFCRIVLAVSEWDSQLQINRYRFKFFAFQSLWFKYVPQSSKSSTFLPAEEIRLDLTGSWNWFYRKMRKRKSSRSDNEFSVRNFHSLLDVFTQLIERYSLTCKHSSFTHICMMNIKLADTGRVNPNQISFYSGASGAAQYISSPVPKYTYFIVIFRSQKQSSHIQFMLWYNKISYNMDLDVDLHFSTVIIIINWPHWLPTVSIW